MSSAERVSIVVAPTFAFERLERAMSAAGWPREAVPTATPGILAGEPELAAFRSQRHGVRATYTFNPAVRFRVLSLSGGAIEAAAAELTEALPVLDLETVRDFLDSPDERLVLVALFAARELELFMAADRVDALRAHSNPRIAQLAEKTLAELTQHAVAEGIREIQAREKQDHGRSAIFPLLGERQARRQVLRWLIHDFTAATPDILKVVRAALADEDWEVRASAMIAAVRFRAAELGPAVRALTFPETTREGADRVERGILHAMQKAALAILGGSPEAVPLHDLMLGTPAAHHDRLFLFVHSLAEPLQIEPVEPIVHPATGLGMVRVDAVDHWLGADDPDIPGNPIRSARPGRAFHIAATPLSAARAIQLLGGGTAPDSPNAYRCTESEARQLLGALHMTLSTATQWEMAMRGTDGRRKPWGNGWEGDPAALTSPWGLSGLSRNGEWAIEDGVMVVCGGDRDMRCAWRGRPRAGQAFALRPVLPAG